MTEPERHDWQQIVLEVREMYRAVEGKVLTDYKLGLMTEMSHMSVRILATRGEPKFRSGEKLLNLHADLLRKSVISQSDTSTA